MPAGKAQAAARGLGCRDQTLHIVTHFNLKWLCIKSESASRIERISKSPGICVSGCIEDTPGLKHVKVGAEGLHCWSRV